MTLLDLVSYLTDPNGIERLYLHKNVDTNTDAVLIYAKEILGVDSEVMFFGFEETEDDLFYERDGIQYIQLFPLDYAQELITSDLDLLHKGYTDLEIATRLLQYRSNDA